MERPARPARTFDTLPHPQTLISPEDCGLQICVPANRSFLANSADRDRLSINRIYSAKYKRRSARCRRCLALLSRRNAEETLRISRPGSAAIRLGTLEYEGSLVVRDPAAFLAGLFTGFGRARAFGCGLMLIRRV